jgi:hypothetical protein
MKGLVYVLWNPIFNHYGECYKIGCTNDINKRIRGYTTSYIEPCIIKYKTELRHDYKILERKIHNKLCDYRVKTKREFFKVSLNTIIDIIDELINDNDDIPPDNISIENDIIDYTTNKEEYELKDIIESLPYNIGSTEDIDSIDKYMKEIRLSQEIIFKVLEKNNLIINRNLLNIQRIVNNHKKDTIVIRIKDPIEDIKIIKENIDNIKEFTVELKYKYANHIIDILSLYKTDKISSSFKEVFLSILKITLEGEDIPNVFNFNLLKEKILRVRDIRWLLIEMEKYPKYFKFIKEDLNLMNENEASRDNIYLVKKFLKKENIQV